MWLEYASKKYYSPRKMTLSLFTHCVAVKYAVKSAKVL